jgi:ribosome recycling factor
MLKSMKKDGELSEDDLYKAQDQVQKITDEQIKLIDVCFKDKEKEILEF